MESKVDRRQRVALNVLEVRDAMRIHRRTIVQEDFEHPSPRLKEVIDGMAISLDKLKQVIDDL